GGQSFLTKTTTILAIIFVITSLSIAKITSAKKSKSLLKEDVKQEEVQPAPQTGEEALPEAPQGDEQKQQ
ncbi:MAG TPA: preprotein translocase subunit SecG, partial [Candidatus Mcinerneyibacteriales bacterium]|nr:preprotein translocase subunit SecG [Candidatus Mcinerneyibacteriales bacterium]